MSDRDGAGPLAFLQNGGEAAGLIAAIDWSHTSLGDIGGWSPEVKAVVAMVLRSPLPITTLWGEAGAMIYNDAYSEFAGARHPDLLGMNVREAWPEVAAFNDNVVKTVFRRGETLSYTDQELTLHRAGRPDRAWLNLDYSPILAADGRRLGVIAIVIETTARVEADRRLRDERLQLEQMYRQSPGFVALLDGPDHRFVLWNDAYQQLIGHRDIGGKTVVEALPDAVEQGYLELLDGVFASGQSVKRDTAHYAVRPEAGGEIVERRVDFVFQPLTSADGLVTGIFVSGVDVTERALAQEEIEASAAQFRTLAQSVPNHVWTAPADGLLDWFNHRVFEYCGLGFAELEGEGWARIVHPDDLADAASSWAASLASGETYETEFRIQQHDGHYRWHLIRALPIRAEDGQVVRWIGTNTDIHDQKLSVAETMRDRDRLWHLSQDLMLVCDFTGTITAVNPSASRLLGWDEDEMIGKFVTAFVHPDDLEPTTAELDGLAGGAKTLAFENRYRAKDGGYRLLAWNAVPEGGRIHAVGRDITDERRLARDRERIWSLSPIVQLVCDQSGVVTAVNPSWSNVLGWPADETIGRNVLEFVAADQLPAAERRLDLIARTDARVIESDSIFVARDGARRRFHWHTVPEGGMLYVFGRDVTAEVEAAEGLAVAEEALRQSQKMEAVGQLTGGIAHDFNNLLQGITGSLEIVQRRVAQGRFGELDRFIGGATTAANRAAALTHRLLAFSRRQPLDPRPVRANPLIASMEDLLRRTLGERVELGLVLAGGLWPTLCDPNQLESAILNLAINARDAMPDGGHLTIETCNAHLDDAYAAQQRDVKPGQYVCICVSDTGTGMSQDVIAKAFEPFFTTKPIGQGTGLGLSMIYGFARQSEGYAKIYSEEGKGTTFKLYLPRHRGAVEADEALPALTSDQTTDQGEVVLVVEDEPVVRGLIVEVLEELGYRAIEAADGPKGIDMLHSRRRIDLLITDIGLPGLNGRQVADAGRTVRPDLKVLFMTGYAENAALASGFLEAGMAMITKPFAMEALATRVRAILEQQG